MNETVFFALIKIRFVRVDKNQNRFSFLSYQIKGITRIRIFHVVDQQLLNIHQLGIQLVVILFGNVVDGIENIRKVNKLISELSKSRNGFLPALVGTGNRKNQGKHNSDANDGKIDLQMNVKITVEKIDDNSFYEYNKNSSIEYRGDGFVV